MTIIERKPVARPIQVGHFDEAMKRLFEMRGSFPYQLSPFFSPVVTSDTMLQPPWTLYAGGSIGCYGGAVAAQFRHVTIGPYAPVADEVLVIDSIDLASTTNGTFLIGIAAAIAGTTQEGYFSDSRTGPAGSGLGSRCNLRMEYGATAGAFAGTMMERLILPANVQLLCPGPWVIGGRNPSPGLQIYQETANISLAVRARFRIYRVSE